MSEIQMNLVGAESKNEQPGFLKRILWVFTSPGKLMASLAEKPRILFALILSAVTMDVFYLANLPLYKDMLRTTQLSLSGYMESMTGQALTPEMVEKSLPAAVIQGLISTPLGSLLGLVVMTVVFFAILKIVGGQGKFKAYLSVTGYAYTISALYYLIAMIIAQFTGSLHIDPTLTSLATLASQDSVGVVLYSVLKSLDIFNIWYYVVLAIGLVAVSKAKKKHVYTVVSVIFVISLIYKVVTAVALTSIM